MSSENGREITACQPSTIHNVDHSTTHLNDFGSTVRKRKHEYQSPRHRNTWSASAQHQSMGSEMVCFGTLTNIPFPQLRNTAPRALPWPVASSPPQSRYLHVLTQLSHVSISLLVRSALRVQLRPPSRMSAESQALATTRPMKLCLSHGHGLKSECLFQGSRGEH